MHVLFDLKQQRWCSFNPSIWCKPSPQVWIFEIRTLHVTASAAAPLNAELNSYTSPSAYDQITTEQLTHGGAFGDTGIRVSGPVVLFARVALGYCSMWPRWVDGRSVRPAACCSASPPIRARLPLSSGPMRAAGSGLGSRVGLFNLRGGQQAAPSTGWMDVGDGNVSELFHYQMLQMCRGAQMRPGIHAHFINRLPVVNDTGSFLTINGAVR